MDWIDGMSRVTTAVGAFIVAIGLYYLGGRVSLLRQQVDTLTKRVAKLEKDREVQDR